MGINKNILDAVKRGEYSCQSIPEIALYSRKGFKGTQWRSSVNAREFSKSFDNKAESAIICLGKWQLFDGPNFSGRSWYLNKGRYTSLSATGIPNDTVSSYKLVSPNASDAGVEEFLPDEDIETNSASVIQRLPEIIFFKDPGFTGYRETVNQDFPRLPRGFNDVLSGVIVVNGIWRFYEHRDYKGRRWELGPGYYSRLSDFGIPDNTVSSFRVWE